MQFWSGGANARTVLTRLPLQSLPCLQRTRQHQSTTESALLLCGGRDWGKSEPGRLDTLQSPDRRIVVYNKAPSCPRGGLLPSTCACLGGNWADHPDGNYSGCDGGPRAITGSRAFFASLSFAVKFCEHEFNLAQCCANRGRESGISRIADGGEGGEHRSTGAFILLLAEVSTTAAMAATPFASATAHHGSSVLASSCGQACNTG